MSGNNVNSAQYRTSRRLKEMFLVDLGQVDRAFKMAPKEIIWEGVDGVTWLEIGTSAGLL
jgi:hypothetical protein